MQSTSSQAGYSRNPFLSSTSKIFSETLSLKEVGDVIVVDNEMPMGIVTERDLVRRVIAKERGLDTKVSDLMSKPLITIGPDASLKEAARKMVKHRIRRLSVLKTHKLVGIIVVSDFARHLGKKTLTEGILEAIWSIRFFRFFSTYGPFIY